MIGRILAFAFSFLLSTAYIKPVTRQEYKPNPFDTSRPLKLNKPYPLIMDANLSLLLHASKLKFRVDEPLDISIRIKNNGNNLVTIPHILFNHDTLFVKVQDSKKNNVDFPNSNLGVFVGYPKDKDTGNVIIQTIALGPDEFWGSDTLLRAYPIVLGKPGRYQIYVQAVFFAHGKGFPENVWLGKLESSINVSIVP